MKFHKLLLSLLAGAALFTACQLEEPVSDSDLAVKVNPSLLSFDGKTAGEAEIEVTALASWTVAIPADADWVTITPASGGAGTAKVKVAVLAGGEKDRKAEITFKAGTDTQLLTIEQSGGVKYGTKDNPYTASKAYDWVAGKPADTNTEEVYIKGIICKIDAPYKADDYGNASFYISDDGKDEGKVFQCYRCLYITPIGEKAGVKYSNPADPNISVGDEVLIYGQCVNYKGNTPETSQNKAWLIELKAGTNPVLTVASPAVEILADATEAKFAVEAKNVAKWSVAAKETYDWVTDFTKEGTTSGDITVTVAPNASADARVAKFAVSADGVDAIELTLTQKGASVASTVAEVTAQITSADRNNPSAYSANLTGAVVSYVNGDNAYIEDASGAILLYLKNHGLEPGKKISGAVKGTGYLYNGLPEITALGSEVVIENGGTIPQTVMTIADLLNNYAANYSRRILLKGVTVKDGIANGDRNGVVTQNGAEINVYAGLNNADLVLTEGATGDFLCFPTVYVNKNTGAVTNQLSFWDNAHFTAGGGDDPQPSGVAIKTADEFIAWIADGTKDATLEADITLPASFEPDTLKATFDGKNHTITYSLDVPAGAVYHTGLFSNVAGTVKNLKVAGSIKSAVGIARMGGIAGTAASGAVFDNCESSVDILYTIYGDAVCRLGGIVGAAEDNLTLTNCTNKGKVQYLCSESDNKSRANNIGGLVGFMEKNGLFENCVNDGEVDFSAIGTPRLGGIVGYVNNLSELSFINCTNNGALNIESTPTSGYNYVGGISGYYGTPANSSHVLYKNCSNTGNITLDKGADKTQARVGGILCHCGGTAVDATQPISVEVINCSNSGNIDIKTSSSASNHIGGIVGFTEKTTCIITCTGCTNTGSISVPNSNATIGCLLGYSCNPASTFTGFTIGKNVVLTTAASGKVGLVAGAGYTNPNELTAALAGKVQGGKIVKGETETVASAENYKDMLVGANFTGTSDGVTFGE